MISLEHVNKYFGDHHVLKDISFSVDQGEKIVIIGPSGSGKSTLIRCINRLEKVSDGKIIVDGINITEPKAPIQSVRKKVAMVFQGFNLYAHKTIIDNLTLAPIKVKGVSKEEATRTGMEYLERVGLADKAKAYPAQLSGGQQQRVAIARSLNMHPEVILFDEPTSALDPEMIQEVLDVMVDLSKQSITMICVTHEMGFARQVADKVIFMDEGKIVETGTPEHFFTNTQNERAKEFLSKIIHNS
ncbi:amino acid ABC transporter ATP-binding protein [Enterococcus sp. BWB1-3]|uniref:amino acid ABC transporter ATP-binding protein n=1 Tax=unclassified Enterococcus TaxID=2608891 RepID=UPI001921A01E|nr:MULTISPECIES: amino acid ABC transporter ATP-binding protein [unclassified Enterococcus]MBL1230556.1 amino acid ABC transporter ATP-binding protein [Enterococcus sp. BWB1-3]MCB5954282.1 amino acid ABC transporter ATP-binding protein [Enterococcus sp. CWB-B31]